MKHLPLIILFLSFSSGVSVAHQKPESERGKRGDRPERPDRRPPGMSPARAKEFISHHDKNDDAKISREEFDASERIAILEEEQRAIIFKRLDKNDDGFITTEDLRDMNHDPKRRGMMEKMDQDKDGRITRKEFAAAPHLSDMTEEQRDKVFDRLDKDKNGFLDRKDQSRRDRHRPNDRRPQIKLEELDLDNNKSLSWAEFQSAPPVLAMPEDRRRKLFDQLDTDRDEQLSVRELREVQSDKPPRPQKGDERPKKTGKDTGRK